MSIFRKKDVSTYAKHLRENEERRVIKAEHKIQKKENKTEERKRKQKIKGDLHWFNFFTKWFFIGIILVLLSICLSMYIDSIGNNSNLYNLKPLFTILSGILSTIGIALFVGCVFDFSKNSEAFVAFLSKILSDIVVSKKFANCNSKLKQFFSL